MQRRIAHAVALAACLGATTCRAQTPSTGFEGTWVTTLGPRVFMVLTIEQNSGAFAGKLTRPDQMTTSDGVTFTDVGDGIIDQPIVKATLEGSALRLAFEDPKNPAEPDEWDMTLAGNDDASMKMVDIPLDIRFPFKRHHGSEPPTVARDWDPQASYSLASTPSVPSPEMAAIYDADQQARQGDFTKFSDEQWAAISKGDAERRKQTRALLDGGAIQTGLDYRKAAFVFQHGETPGDYLVAHTLAMVAMKKGDTAAAWIGAASLDRYLNAIKKPQIYGTQFSVSGEEHPFDRAVISDALRRELGVPEMAKQRAP